SGRRAVARMIHQGATDDRVWLGVDCAAVTDESLVAAIASMTARTRAAGITLVLEGLDELSEAAQLKLEQITAGNRPVSLHLIASSLQTPATLLQQQRLRPGLASQLSTLVIELPPLSQRRDDIPLLCQSLVEEANAASSKQLRGVAPDCLDQLQAYQWPGNLHELANTVREAHRHAEGAEITISDLPKRLSYAADEARRPAKVQQPIDLEAHLESIESELIQKTLKQAKGNKSRAAQLLGLTRPKLYRRMVQLGLEEAEAPPAKKQRPNHRPRRKLPDLALPEAMLPAFESAGDELPDFIEDLPFEEQPE
ncbi:MAG: helix-turn-helix domain-containing protein, partial [Planctomycetota bacterium]|nr:helix-turn-helix domain-containing protein [Planctomycetota bacterium]